MHCNSYRSIFFCFSILNRKILCCAGNRDTVGQFVLAICYQILTLESFAAVFDTIFVYFFHFYLIFVTEGYPFVQAQ